MSEKESVISLLFQRLVKYESDEIEQRRKPGVSEIPGFYNDSMRTASALRHREGSQRAVQEFVERPHGFSQSYDLTDDF